MTQLSGLVRALLFLLGILSACTPAPAAPTSSCPLRRVARPLVVDPPEHCFGFCANLAEFKCEESGFSPHGYSCVDLCQAVQRSGTLALPVDCVALATSVDKIRACGAGEPVGRVRCANVLTVEAGDGLGP